MTSAELIPATLLKRKAVVYVRQSTQSHVMTNLESQRRQYDLVDVARQRGFVDIEVIDDDLGRSASGTGAALSVAGSGSSCANRSPAIASAAAVSAGSGANRCRQPPD